MDFFYGGDRESEIRTLLGDKYIGPKQFQHGEETLIAKLTPEPGSDGRPVEIYECRMPAVFFVVQVLPSTDWKGRPQPGYRLGTGSSMHALTFNLAKAIVEGMLDVEPLEGTNG